MGATIVMALTRVATVTSFGGGKSALSLNVQVAITIPQRSKDQMKNNNEVHSKRWHQ